MSDVKRYDIDIPDGGMIYVPSGEYVLASDYDALAAKHAALAESAKKLLAKIDAIVEHPEYQAVWTNYACHGGRYGGPQWVDESNALRTALENHQ